MPTNEIRLRYGCNPHQTPARIYATSGSLPVKVLNGSPGYINFLDALNSWQLVRELRQSLGLPAAASFKHVSPAGAAVGVPLSATLQKAYFVDGLELSALATAYARARGSDRVSSFGDWVALSDVVDVATAQLINREVSDGVIAPGYAPEAFALLSKKRGGKYVVIEIDPAYAPAELEAREVFGITFEQKRNDLLLGPSQLQNVTTQRRELTDAAKRDLLVSLITLKYTQSNSICLALDGQTIGVGAGQQSRIHCTRLAASKADIWYLRQHPSVLGLKFRPGLHRPERDNAIDQYLREDLTAAEEKVWREVFEAVPTKLTLPEKQAWLSGLKEVALGSDGFIPFRDNIDRAARSGVKYVAQPGGSLRDEEIVRACDEYGMTMAFSGVRLFHH
jgi:phosphoribosylaminoimidazolecarboxamide formyltransferase/IMP cyclohydrolase